MASHKKIHFKLWAVLFTGFLVLSIGIAIFGIFYHAKDYTIDSPQRFIDAINHSAETKQAYNYVITDSFEIDVVDLPVGKSFYGHLKGNGKTITITSKEEYPMISPIFNKIQKGASVERLKIELNTVLGEDDNVADIALLATDNFGTVKDCFFSIQNIFIGSKCQNASALINNNFGEINSVCVSVNNIDSSQTANNWQCCFGAVSTINYALTKNIFINVLFSNIDIFTISFNNQSVGYVFGKIGKNVKVNDDIDGIYLFGDNSFWNFSVDAFRMESNDILKADKPNSSDIKEFIRYNGSTSIAWSASSIDDYTGFPLLN